MTPIGPERHVRNADLLRFVDGEGNAAFRQRVADHLAICATCSAAAARLHDTARVVRRLDVLDDATAYSKLPPTFAELAQRGSRARTVDWRRAAAVILFLGAGAAVARPAAAWLHRLISAGKPAHAVSVTQHAAKTPAAAPIDTLSAAYSFTPSSGELRMQFANAESDAELVVHAHDQNAASLQLQSVSPLPPVLILPNAVSITNTGNHGTRYELALPRNVDLIVSIAGHAPQRIVAGSLPVHKRLD